MSHKAIHDRLIQIVGPCIIHDTYLIVGNGIKPHKVAFNATIVQSLQTFFTGYKRVRELPPVGRHGPLMVTDYYFIITSKQDKLLGIAQVDTWLKGERNTVLNTTITPTQKEVNAIHKANKASAHLITYQKL